MNKEKFAEKLRNNELVLSLIGMSNVGKTYWGRKSKEIGFRHIECDQIIEKNFRKNLWVQNIME